MRRCVPLVLSALLAAVPPFAGAAPPTVGGCPVFPANNYWNTPVDTLPVHASSNAWVASIGNTARLHADWGNVLADNYGIPFTTVTGAQPLVPIVPDPVFDYSDESDPGPYPVPPSAPIEGGPASSGDRHVIVIETTNCRLYELYNATPINGGMSWSASSFAKFDLNSHALRPAGWTSADAAGLPIFPGLVRWEEVVAGEIAHAIRFTAVSIWGRDAATQAQKYIWPARHASGTNTTATRPPMGARFRLKAAFDVTPYSAPTQVILQAFKKYGLVLADAGSNWFFQGVSDTNWPDQVFSELGSIAGSNFEAVDTLLMQVNPDSAQAALPSTTNPPRLGNISTRGQVLTGDNVMIGGFIIGGATAKTVLVRARGPSMIPAGVLNAMANPTLTLVNQSTAAIIGTNDNWGDAVNASAITATGKAPTNAFESAILVSLNPGAYTAVVSGVGGTTGVGIVEVFEIDGPAIPLTNISTRGRVLTGDDVMIGGFIIDGDSAKTVLIRARGPSMIPAGVTDALPNPQMTLVNQATATIIGTNDDWGTAANASAITATGLAPTNAFESAILVTLQPGAYTVVVSGVGGVTGVGIVEVFAQ